MILVCQAIRRKTFAGKDRQDLRERRQILAVNKKIIRYNNNSSNRKQVNNNE